MSGKRDPRANWLDEDPFEKVEKESEKVMLPIVTLDQVESKFKELKSIF